MPKLTEILAARGGKRAALGRRTLLRKSLVGGAAIAGAFIPAIEIGLNQDAEAAETPSALFDPKGDGFRRVVTGNKANGRSYVLKDERVKYGDIWHSSAGEQLGTGGPRDPNKVLPDTRPATVQQTEATRFYYTAIAPARGALDRANPAGMHRTSTLSYVLIANGEVVVVLDEGEVTLRAGDVLVMRNAKHAWHNPGTEPVGLLITQYLVG